jgi:hypothetical protein
MVLILLLLVHISLQQSAHIPASGRWQQNSDSSHKRSSIEKYLATIVDLRNLEITITSIQYGEDLAEILSIDHARAAGYETKRRLT